MMTENASITDIYFKLVDEYPDGDIISRSSIFWRALEDGKISVKDFKRAWEYYKPMLWYLCDPELDLFFTFKEES